MNYDTPVIWKSADQAFHPLKTNPLQIDQIVYEFHLHKKKGTKIEESSFK